LALSFIAFVLATATALFLAARRWAGYFCVLCDIACAKAVLALAFGPTVAGPAFVTDGRLALELLVC
jgi:hypothetical protein